MFQNGCFVLSANVAASSVDVGETTLLEGTSDVVLLRARLGAAVRFENEGLNADLGEQVVHGGALSTQTISVIGILKAL